MDGLGVDSATFVAVGGAADGTADGGTCVGAGAHAASVAIAVNMIAAKLILLKHGRFISSSLTRNVLSFATRK